MPLWQWLGRKASRERKSVASQRPLALSSCRAVSGPPCFFRSACAVSWATGDSSEGRLPDHTRPGTSIATDPLSWGIAARSQPLLPAGVVVRTVWTEPATLLRGTVGTGQGRGSLSTCIAGDERQGIAGKEHSREDVERLFILAVKESDDHCSMRVPSAFDRATDRGRSVKR